MLLLTDSYRKTSELASAVMSKKFQNLSLKLTTSKKDYPMKASDLESAYEIFEKAGRLIQSNVNVLVLLLMWNLICLYGSLSKL